MGDIIEERRRMLKRALTLAEGFCICISRLLGPVKIILYGSYARGDFNAWSDIDVLVIVDRIMPASPVRRLEMIEECLEKHPLIEPVIMTVEELSKRKNNPLVREAMNRGKIICDRLKAEEGSKE